MIKTIFEHRSIRKYLSTPISCELTDRILEAGIRASNTGNMQIYSIIATTDAAVKAELSPCHFAQAMVCEAPLILTFCVDVHRFSLWCKLRGAEPQYDNFVWFVGGAVDAILTSQNIALAAESEGLGICYLGTTIYNADRIVEVLGLPQGVIPVTTMVVGYPAPETESPLTSRLPLNGVVHKDRYIDYTPEVLDEIWAERESSDETKELLKINERANLAQIFTERRYKGVDNKLFSKKYFDTLVNQGFFNQ